MGLVFPELRRLAVESVNLRLTKFRAPRLSLIRSSEAGLRT